ncbi:hypothetical protein [Eubacterium ventriosum]|uniref:hypothetical protein n=1 Tax=Eubacterium ventriosum TaxID=39496 RepID=UPI00351FE266
MKELAIKCNVKNEVKDLLKEKILTRNPEVIDCVFEQNDELKIIGLKVTYDDSVDENEIKEYVQNIVKDMDKAFAPTVKTLWENQPERKFYTNIYEQLEDLGYITEMGTGIVALGDILINLLKYFDNQIIKIAKKNYNPMFVQYPTLIKYDVLDRINYMNTLHTSLMFVSSVDECSEKDEFQQLDYDSYFTKTKGLKMCLPPSICYHTYFQFCNTEITDNMVVSAKGKTFRHEGKAARKLERLWDFSMREVIFLGDEKFVKDNAVGVFVDEIILLLERLGLNGKIVSADDMFFCENEAIGDKIAKKIENKKYEVRLNIDEENTIAVGSFNLHYDFFGEHFNIRKDGKNIHTSCTGYGLERFVYAFLCQHGIDADKWPEEVKKEILDGK